MTSDDVITIEVDGKSLQARKGQMLIEVTDANDIYVPRFCYHKKLSVAANCRMCLVEVEKAPKPLPACATPVMDGMKVFSKSPQALEAQKSVMEFLLINHPLDCPICDQGGECELQDLAMGYGKAVSRYQERKRVVKDKNIGPLVQTDMTRCIHCTRCIRFGEEIAGMRELGATGRGEHMQIGTYIEKSMASEMSGNIIDLCPVGALTSKPFRFSARTWEITQHNGIAPHDPVGSNIHFHVAANRVKRVVPADNEAINEIWLSDRDRFSYEGLYSGDRLLVPMLKQDGAWQEVDWETAFQAIKARLGTIVSSEGPDDRIGALASATCTTEELYLLQKFVRGVGSNNIDHRLQQGDFSDQETAPVFPWLGQTIVELQQLDAALVIGGYPRKQQPIINHRLRKAALSGADIMFINPVDYAFNFDIGIKAIIPPGELLGMLAGIVKALLKSTGSDPDGEIQRLTSAFRSDKRQRQIAEKLSAADNCSVLLGNLAMAHTQFSVIRYLAGMIATLTGSSFGYLGEAANTAGAWLAGAVPHRVAAGVAGEGAGLDTQAMLEQQLSAYLLLNIEPELDCWDGHLALQALQAAACVIALTPYKTERMEEYADILLPIAQYAENAGSYINMEGVQQSFSRVVPAPGEARPAWKVLRVLGNSFELDQFDYTSVMEISDEIKVACDRVKPENLGAWQTPASLVPAKDAMQRITDVPMNSADPLVRRAPALQHTTDVADGKVHISKRSARAAGLSGRGNIRVRQNGTERVLPVVIDDRLPPNTVLIHAAHPDSQGLGPWFGDISLEQAG
ncbi:MAG: NADH-quinone oxidoreductase subunit NuoG [Gammaproteobacteria bacterium]